MNKLKLSVGLILTVYILIAASCTGNSKKSAAPEKNQEVSVIEVSIGGMSCTGCEQTIQNNVGKLDGIKSVKATFTNGIAIIEYYEGLTDTTVIKGAISGCGYTVKKFIAHTNEEGEK
jgi:copper chaperone CopZ